jgi:hypothetical protein
MYIDIAAGFKYGTLDYSQYLALLDTNLDKNTKAFIDGYNPAGTTLLFSAVKFSGSTIVKFKKTDVENVLVKFVARLQRVKGVFWADNFILQDGVVNIDFKSQSEAGGSGELKTFNGSLTQGGQPVSRAVYALAIGGDVPKLLASAVSDDMGNYSLEWNGYTGQILVTATDDYGAPFAAEALLSIGARVHPATPNGYIYEAASPGTLGLEEPAWPAIEGESVASGQVQLVAKPFYRPKSAGPFTIV